PAARAKVRQTDLRAQGVTVVPTFDPKNPSREQLFCNNRYMTLARYPNEGWLRIADVPQEGELKYEGMHRGPNPVLRDGIPIGKHYGRFTYDGDRPAHWQQADDIWMHGYWWEDYQDEYQRADRLDPVKKEIWPAPPWPAYGFHKRQRYYFLNVLEELDQAGEWYLDRKAGILYFWPPTAPEKADITFPELLGPLVSLRDTTYVSLRGLILECARGSAISITGGSHNEVAGCTVRNVGDTAITVDGGTDNGVRSCDIYEVGSTGIALNGGDRKTLTPSNHYAENCHLHDFARVLRTYHPGISLSGVGQRVSHCYLHDAPHAAITYGGNDHVVEYTEFTRTGLETGDVGVIYTAMDWTNMGEVFRYNYFHDIRSPDKVSVGAMTIYLDLPCGGVQVYGNVFYDVPRAFFSDSGRGIVIENNVFIKCTPSVQFYVWEDPQYFKEKGPWPMVENLKAVNYDQPPYSTRYPALARLAEDFALGEDHIVERQLPKDNVVRRNVSYDGEFLDMNRLVSLQHVKVEQNLIAAPVVFTGSFEGSGTSARHTNGDAAAAEVLGKTGNVIFKGNPGFADIEAQDFTLKPDSPVWKLGFKPIPFAQIGLQRDTYRRSLPVLEPVIRPGSRTFAGELTVTLKPPTRGERAVLRYTLDGSEPGPQSPQCTGPLTVKRTTTLKAAAFAADGKSNTRSQVITATFTAARLGPGGGVYLSDLEGTDVLAYDSDLVPVGEDQR
ncbi:MAG: right-handed parallel beta-helix repeat-containing protein, partial [Armatimonadota bacterium]